ncbi:MAG: hypothetical protein NZ922_00935 [Candidatus Methanomethyliaceae archaeon]|nr:hypothetical protein [Candidatus Methanomethyliaceae archaeon]MDW7970258.1 hypothetical protein [Nitrososphaerota archaeon]
MNEVNDLAMAINDILLGLSLSIPLEISGAIILNAPHMIGYWSAYDPSIIVLCKLIILIGAIAIIELMKHWGLMYAIGYLIGSIIMGIFFGFDLFNLAIIFMVIFSTFLITIFRMRWRR